MSCNRAPTQPEHRVVLVGKRLVAGLVDKEQQTVWSNLQSWGDFLIYHEPSSTCPSQAREPERAGLLPDEDETAPAISSRPGSIATALVVFVRAGRWQTAGDQITHQRGRLCPGCTPRFPGYRRWETA